MSEFRANHSNEDTFWPGAPAHKICICYPNAARQLVLKYGCLSGPLTSRVFGRPRDGISVRYGSDLTLTVYTGKEGEKGQPDLEAMLWGLRKTNGLWKHFQEAADAEAAKKTEAPSLHALSSCRSG